MTVDININTHCLLYVYAPILIKLFKNIIINNIILNHLHSFSYHYALPKCRYNNILLVTIMYLLMSYFHYPMYSFSLTCGSATECFVSQHAIASQSFSVLALLSLVNTECHCHGCDGARYKLCPAIVHYTNRATEAPCRLGCYRNVSHSRISMFVVLHVWSFSKPFLPHGAGQQQQ